MRTAITIARTAQGETWEFLAGPDTPIPEQRAGFKKLRTDPEAAKVLSEIQLWESGSGLVMRHRFKAPRATSNPAPAVPETPAPSEPTPQDPASGEPDAPDAPEAEPAEQVPAEGASDPTPDEPAEEEGGGNGFETSNRKARGRRR